MKRSRHGGPGTELEQLYRALGAQSFGRFDTVRRRMDEMGCEECRRKVASLSDDATDLVMVWWQEGRPWVQTVEWWGRENILRHLLSGKAASSEIEEAIRYRERGRILEAVEIAEGLGFR